MKKTVILLAIICSLTMTVFAELTPVAVIDFSGEGVSKTTLLALSDFFRSELIGKGQYKVMDRGNMNEIFAEIGFQQSGACTDEACLIEVGQLLGVMKMFGGSIGKIGAKYMITVKIIDVKTGSIDKIVTEKFLGAEEDLDQPISNIAVKISGSSDGLTKSSFYVKTEPPGAKVYLDDVFKGNSPIAIPIDTIKEYTIGVESQGYQTWQQKIMAKDGEVVGANAVLLKGTSSPISVTKQVVDISLPKVREVMKGRLMVDKGSSDGIRQNQCFYIMKIDSAIVDNSTGDTLDVYNVPIIKTRIVDVMNNVSWAEYKKLNRNKYPRVGDELLEYKAGKVRSVSILMQVSRSEMNRNGLINQQVTLDKINSLNFSLSASIWIYKYFNFGFSYTLCDLTALDDNYQLNFDPDFNFPEYLNNFKYYDQGDLLPEANDTDKLIPIMGFFGSYCFLSNPYISMTLFGKFSLVNGYSFTLANMEWTDDQGEVIINQNPYYYQFETTNGYLYGPGMLIEFFPKSALGFFFKAELLRNKKSSVSWTENRYQFIQSTSIYVDDYYELISSNVYPDGEKGGYNAVNLSAGLFINFFRTLKW